jgi:hypothetical protein
MWGQAASDCPQPEFHLAGGSSSAPEGTATPWSPYKLVSQDKLLTPQVARHPQNRELGRCPSHCEAVTTPARHELNFSQSPPYFFRAAPLSSSAK